MLRLSPCHAFESFKPIHLAKNVLRIIYLEDLLSIFTNIYSTAFSGIALYRRNLVRLLARQKRFKRRLLKIQQLTTQALTRELRLTSSTFQLSNPPVLVKQA